MNINFVDGTEMPEKH